MIITTIPPATTTPASFRKKPAPSPSSSSRGLSALFSSAAISARQYDIRPGTESLVQAQLSCGAIRSWERYWFARVADSVRIGSERQAWHSQRRRPWLRLVRTDLEDLGPVSPELVLVDPPLAAAVRVTPDPVVVQKGRAGEGIQPTRRTDLERPEVGSGGGDTTTTASYDTSDLLLEQHGVELELTTRGSDRSWRLTAARGEQIVVPDDGSVVPQQIQSLLRTVAQGRELVAVPARSSDPEIRRLEDHVAR